MAQQQSNGDGIAISQALQGSHCDSLACLCVCWAAKVSVSTAAAAAANKASAV